MTLFVRPDDLPRAWLCVAAISLWFLSFPALARAEVRAVVVLRTGREPACLDVDGLRAAIRRDTGLDARAGAAPPRADAETVALHVSARGSAVEIAVTGPGLDVHHMLTASSCETTTDQVAAFVASALAPVTTVAAVPSERSVHDQLADATARMLRADGVDLAARGARLAFEADGEGVWWLVVSGRDPSCSQRLHVGIVSRLSDPLARSIADDAKRALPAAEACSPPWTPTSRRAEILAESLKPYEGGGSFFFKSFGAVEALGGASLVALAVGPMAHEQAAPVLLVGGGLMTVGSLASYFVPDDAYVPTVGVSVGLGSSLALASFEGLRWRDDLAPSPGTFATLAAGGFATTLLYIHDVIKNPPTGYRRLGRAYARIDTPAKRAQITKAELDELERDYLRLDTRISPWVLATPNLIAGYATMILNLADLSVRDTSGARLGFGLGVGTVALSLVSALSSPVTEAYRSKVKNEQLSLDLTPGGVALNGRF